LLAQKAQVGADDGDVPRGQAQRVPCKTRGFDVLAASVSVTERIHHAARFAGLRARAAGVSPGLPGSDRQGLTRAALGRPSAYALRASA